MINISKSAQRIMSLSDKNIYFVSTTSTIFDHKRPVGLCI